MDDILKDISGKVKSVHTSMDLMNLYISDLEKKMMEFDIRYRFSYKYEKDKREILIEYAKVDGKDWGFLVNGESIHRISVQRRAIVVPLLKNFLEAFREDVDSLHGVISDCLKDLK
jgi:hypothetical protein